MYVSIMYVCIMYVRGLHLPLEGFRRISNLPRISYDVKEYKELAGMGCFPFRK